MIYDEGSRPLRYEFASKLTKPAKGMDDATQKEHTKRIRELQKFIQSQPSEITEFDEALVKKLLEKVTVHDDYLEFRFKSGVTNSIEM